jgi:hypothetical protein
MIDRFQAYNRTKDYGNAANLLGLAIMAGATAARFIDGKILKNNPQQHPPQNEGQEQHRTQDLPKTGTDN